MTSDKNKTPNEMGFSGMTIYKQLPKSNCSECDLPTCLAFAMNVARGYADISSCPYVTKEFQELIGPAPQIDRRSWYEKIIGRSVDSEDLTKNKYWELLKGNVFWSHTKSFAGCDMHSVSLYYFLEIVNGKIEAITFNMLSGEEIGEIDAMYSTSMHPTGDLQKDIESLIIGVLID